MIVKTIFNLTLLRDRTLNDAKEDCIKSASVFAASLARLKDNGYSIKDYEKEVGIRISINPENVIYEEAIPVDDREVDLIKIAEFNKACKTDEWKDKAETAWSIIKTICFKVIKVGEYEYYCYSLTDREIER